jgi:FkbM family methyltransferase
MKGKTTMDKQIEVVHGERLYKFVTRTETGYDVTVTDEIVIREIFEENVYQVFDGHFAENAGVAVDIGANIGAFSIYAAALGAKTVYAFEPDVLNFEVLRANISANRLGSVIHAHNLAIAGTEGTAELVQGQGASFLRDVRRLTPAAQAMADKAPVVQVQAVTLEQAFEANGIEECDVLKIDCEGSEYGLIAAAPVEILSRVKYLTMEFHSASEEDFGRMIARLSLTHNIHIFGRHDMGGQLYGRCY